MIQAIKRLFGHVTCRHSFKVVSRSVEGATLGWNLRPTRSFRFESRCIHCGKELVETGMVITGDNIHHPEFYDKDGWPIDEKGNRLEIAR